MSPITEALIIALGWRDRYASPRQRKTIYLLDLGLCRYCGRFLWPWSSYHIDHEHPHSRGGWTWLPNLALSCPDCNRQKSARTTSEFTGLPELRRSNLIHALARLAPILLIILIFALLILTY